MKYRWVYTGEKYSGEKYSEYSGWVEYRSTGTVGKSTVVRSTVGGWSGGMKCITLGELCSGEKYSG